MVTFIDWLSSIPVWLVYAIAFLCPALEASTFVGLLIPGEMAMMAAGAVAANGDASPLWAGLAGAVGAVIGDSIGYWIGARKGDELLRSRLGRKIGRDRWNAMRRHLEKKGFFTVVVARFAPALRTLAPAAAGTARQPYGRFFAANAVGGIAWATVSVGLGWALGSSFGSLEKAHWIVVAVGVLFMVAAGWWIARLVKRRRGRRRTVVEA